MIGDENIKIVIMVSNNLVCKSYQTDLPVCANASTLQPNHRGPFDV